MMAALRIPLSHGVHRAYFKNLCALCISIVIIFFSIDVTEKIATDR
jgi:hypothetical protein